jgi:hypothetical protein
LRLEWDQYFPLSTIFCRRCQDANKKLKFYR